MQGDILGSVPSAEKTRLCNGLGVIQLRIKTEITAFTLSSEQRRTSSDMQSVTGWKTWQCYFDSEFSLE